MFRHWRARASLVLVVGQVRQDLGDDFDATVVLAPGYVLVLEPVFWDDGQSGFRAEDIVAVTESGAEVLSNLTYDEYE